MLAREQLTLIAITGYEDGVDSGPGDITETEQLSALIRYVDEAVDGNATRTEILLAIGAAQERLGFVEEEMHEHGDVSCASVGCE